jgi:hypothetical protein
MHSVSAISIPIELGPFDSIGAEEDEKLMKICVCLKVV